EGAIAPPPQPSLALPISSRLPLHRERLPVLHPPQSVLTQEQVATLVQLSRHLIDELEMPLLLEWIWGDPVPDQPHPYAPIYLTQVLPQRPPTDTAPHPENVAVMTSAPSRTQEQRDKGDRPPILIATGAAPGYAVGRVQVIDSGQAATTASQPTILVASHIAPDQLIALQQVVGIVSEQGGLTSHAAIIARELGIPAVVGATGATRRLGTGDMVLIDGDRGEVHQITSLGDWLSLAGDEATPTAVKAYPPVANHAQQLPTHPPTDPRPHPPFPPLSQSTTAASPSSSVEAVPEVPPALRETVLARLTASLIQDHRTSATQLMVNLSQVEALPRVAGLGVDGVGLLRSEHMLLPVLGQQHPQQWLQTGRQQELADVLTQRICQFAEAFAPRPVFYRSLDLRSSDVPSLMPSSGAVPNPLLGLHGTLSYLHNPAVFDVELAALRRVHQAGFANVHLILPFVRSLEELTFCQRRVGQAGLPRNPGFQLWIMAEVPSVLWLLPAYIAAGIQGVSIGSNDLTQLLFATDRTLDVETQVANVSLNSNHPVMRQAIAHIIQQTVQANLPCSICGQAPSQYPDLIPFLITWGITSISVSPDQVEPVRTAIAHAERHILMRAFREH
ncbi:MAG: putative PEP-binding protein, partial [Synechococcales bacterium]|nr:putative PEP-binding protein [Synechococcales bacterium]